MIVLLLVVLAGFVTGPLLIASGSTARQRVPLWMRRVVGARRLSFGVAILALCGAVTIVWLVLETFGRLAIA